jgi:hypothetical protein
MSEEKKDTDNTLLIVFVIFFGLLIFFALIGGLFLFVFNNSFSMENFEEHYDSKREAEKNKKINESLDDVFSKIQNLEIADVDTLELFSKEIGKDKNNVYLITRDLSDAYDIYVESGKSTYILEKLDSNEVDPNSFRPALGEKDLSLESNFFIDKNNVYILESKKKYSYDYDKFTLIVVSYSPSTWSLFEDSKYYSKDESNIYYKNKVLFRADLDSFEYLGYDYAKDKNSIYDSGVIKEILNVSTFKPIHNNIIYMNGTIWREIDSNMYESRLENLYVENPENFTYIGSYFDNSQLYLDYGMSTMDYLFEDGANYYTYGLIKGDFLKYPKQ